MLKIRSGFSVKIQKEFERLKVLSQTSKKLDCLIVQCKVLFATWQAKKGYFGRFYKGKGKVACFEN